MRQAASSGDLSGPVCPVNILLPAKIAASGGIRIEQTAGTLASAMRPTRSQQAVDVRFRRHRTSRAESELKARACRVSRSAGSLLLPNIVPGVAVQPVAAASSRRRVCARYDARLDDDVHGAARHQQMLDIVAADQDELSPAIDAGVIHDFEAAVRPSAGKIAPRRRSVRDRRARKRQCPTLSTASTASMKVQKM